MIFNRPHARLAKLEQNRRTAASPQFTSGLTDTANSVSGYHRKRRDSRYPRTTSSHRTTSLSRRSTKSGETHTYVVVVVERTRGVTTHAKLSMASGAGPRTVFNQLANRHIFFNTYIHTHIYTQV